MWGAVILIVTVLLFGTTYLIYGHIAAILCSIAICWYTNFWGVIVIIYVYILIYWGSQNAAKVFSLSPLVNYNMCSMQYVLLLFCQLIFNGAQPGNSLSSRSVRPFFLFRGAQFSRTHFNYLLSAYIRYIDFIKYVAKKYIYTINHKRIAINYLVFTLWSGLSGATLATMIRWELAYPGSHFFKGDSLRYLQVITSHGLTMIFFVVVPVVFGFFANFFIPYHLGTKDVAFPRLNSLGFWLLPGGYILASKPAFLRSTFFKYYEKPSFFYQISGNFPLGSKHLAVSPLTIYQNWGVRKNIRLGADTIVPAPAPSFIPNNFIQFLYGRQAAGSYWGLISQLYLNRRKKLFITRCPNSILTMSGWTFITPFSANTKYTGLGSQDIAIIIVLLSGVSTTISFTNLLITRRTLSMPGLRNRRVLVPFLTITLLLVMRMLALITPILGAAMIMLLLDRHYNTSFFDYAYGGDIILFQHLFWFFGHPEVYVVIIPGFGVANMLLPYYNTRRIASKHHLIWATYIMAYMGFLVWGHHMYLVGLDHRSRSLYSTITVMISLPAIVKLINWTLTMVNGALKVHVATLFTNSFFFFFLCGGLTGMWLSHVGLNIYVHDTFYVVAHFHFMFSAATFSIVLAAVYYYYFIVFGVTFSKIFAYLQLIYWTCGQWLTFLPLFWVGYNGLPRRYHDYPALYLGWHGMSSIGHLLTLLSAVFFFLMLLDSAINRQVAVSNNFGISRFNKRCMFYLYKILFLQAISSSSYLAVVYRHSNSAKSIEYEQYVGVTNYN